MSVRATCSRRRFPDLGDLVSLVLLQTVPTLLINSAGNDRDEQVNIDRLPALGTSLESGGGVWLEKAGHSGHGGRGRAVRHLW